MGFKLCEISACGINETTPNPKVCCFNLILNIFQQKILHVPIEMTNFFMDDPLINIQE